MTPYWDVVPARARRLGVGERGWFPLVLLLGLVGGLVATAHGLVPTGGLGGPGPAFVGLAGLAAAGGDDDVGRLVEKIERFQAGKDVDFESDREDDVGALYDAVGTLAASAAGEDRYEQTGAERKLERHVEFTDAMLDAVDDVFFVHDEDGYHQRWNETLTDVLGYSDEEIASMHALDGFPEEEHQKVSAAMRAAFETGNARVEATYLTRDGERIPYEFAASALEDPDDNRVIAGIGRDISERKEYERRLEAIVENTANHIYFKDRDGVYEFVNEATADAYGLAVDEMIGMTDAELFDPDSEASVREVDRRVLESGENVTEESVLSVDGEPHVFLTNKFPYRDEGGEIVGVLGISQDITERKENERRLERTSARLEALFERSPDMIDVLDTDGRIVEANQRLCDELGYTEDELTGTKIWEHDRQFDAEEVRTLLGEMSVGERRKFEGEYQRSDSSTFPVEIHLIHLDLGGENRFLAITRDITERKEYERELERQATMLDSLFEQLPVNIYVKDEEGRHVRTSTPYLREDPPGDEEWFQGKTDLDIYPEELAEKTHADDVRVIEEGEPIIKDVEYDPEDEEWLLTSKVPWRNEDGDVRGLLGYTEYITEQKEREQELRETKRNLELVLEGTNTGTWEWDLATGELTWNETLARMIGVERHSAVGSDQAFERCIHPEDVSRVQAGHDQAIEDDEPFQAEFRLRHDDGHWLWVSARGRLVFGEDGSRRMVGIINDITERKEREQEVRETNERLNAVIEASPDAIVALDPEGAVELWNPAAERIFGWSEAEVVGESLPIVSADRTKEFEGLLDRIRDGESISSVEVKRQRKDGDRIDVSLSAAPLRDPDGEVVGIMGILEDISERKAHERELERTTDLLTRAEEMADVGGWSSDITGDLPYDVRWTDKLYDIFELPHDQKPPGAEVVEYFHPADRDRHQTAIDRAIEETEPWDQELRLVTAEGTERWVHNIGEPVVEDDETVEIRGSLQDITERKEREEELRVTRDRLAEHNRTLRRLYEISADQEASFDEKIQQLLELGRERLGTSGAFLSTIHEADDQFEFTHVDGTLDAISPGLVAPFSETYCRKLVETGKIFDVHDALAEGWEGDPAYERWGFESYFGSALYVEGELAGTLSFVDESPHDQPLTDDQRTFVELAAQWMSYELERHQRERQLERYREYTDDVLDAIDDVFYVLDEDGELQRWNDSLVEVTGYSHAQVGEMHALDFFPEDERRPIAEVTEEVFETGDTRIEAAFVTKDGERIPHEFVASTLEDPDGNAVLAGIGRDVTERKARERELRETKRRLELALEGTNTGIWEWNRETDEVVWNETFERMMGLDPGKFEGTYAAFERRVHPDDLPHVEDAIEQAVQNDDLFQTEFRLRHEDGHWIWVAARGQVVDDGDGGERMVGINYDITERKRREAQVRERERELERYHEYTENVLDAIDDVFYLVDEEWNLKRWNESLCEVTGYTDEEIAEMNARSFFAEDDAEQITTALGDIENRAGVPLEADLLTKAGESIPFEFVAAPLNDPDGNEVVAGIGRDISERVEKERQISRLIDNVPGYVYRSDAAPPWQTRFVSGGVRDISGYDPEDLESGAVNWDEDVIADRNEELAAAIQRAVDERESFHLVYPIDTADGERRWVKEQGRGVYAADGSVTAIEGVVIDVTEQRVYEQELERTSQLLEKSQRIAEVGGWTVDMEDGEPQRTQWTERMFDIFELSDDEAPFADEVLEFYHPEDRAERRAAIERAVETGVGWDAEARIITAAGNERWVRTAGEAVVEDGEVVRLHGAVQDVTEQKEREVELERTKDLLQQAGRIAKIGGWELDLTTDPPDMSWTDELYGIHGVEPGTDVDVEMAVGLYHPEDRKYIRNRFQSAIEHGEGYDMEVRLDSTADRHRWVRAMGEAVYEDGEVVKLRGSIQDITEQKEREQELRSTKNRLQQFIETSPVGVVAVDPDGTVTLWNEGMERIFGWPEDEVLGADPLGATTGPETRAGSLRKRVLQGEPFSQVELEQRRKDGERIDVSVSAAPVHDETGAVTEVVAFIEDITARKERERELERTKDMLAQAQELAGIGGWELDASTDPPALTWTDELYRIHGLETGTDVGLSEALDFHHPEDRDRISDAIEQAIQTGRSYDEEVRLFTADGEQRWVRTIGRPVREDDDSVVIRGSLQDITTQKERELALESLHEATRGLLHTESEREVADLVVETATSLFDLSGVAVYTIDEGSNRLVPTAYTDAFEKLSDGAPAVGVSDDTAIWNCFATGGRVVFDDAESARQSQVFGDEVDSGLLVPMGDHGVFVVATDGPRIGDETRRLAETLVATTEAAFDRLASEADLRQRDAELEAQNQRLRRQIQITDIIRRVDQSLVGATSREEVESSVCDRLVESEDVAFAWIGGLGVDGDELVPRVWAGTGETYLDTVALDDLDGAAEPAMTTARTGEATVVGNVVEGLREDAWRRGALANDFHSVVSVPLAVDDYDHGILAVYANEPGVFGDLERAVFAELGQSIANAINAVSAREALHSDTVVELTLEFDDPSGVLARVAAEADCEVEYEGISTRSADETRLFFATTGATADAVADVLDDLYAVSEFRLVDEGDDGRCLFEATITGPVLPSALVDQGASPRSIRATPTGMEAVVDLPTSTNVRQFVETLREQFPTAELASRRNVERGMGTRQQLLSSLMDELTDRQLEVLRTAYFAGFFEWPRASTGEEVAEMLDVTQPTVNRHLRLGQQRLLTQLFDEEAPDLVAA